MQHQCAVNNVYVMMAIFYFQCAVCRVAVAGCHVWHGGSWPDVAVAANSPCTANISQPS